MSIEENHSGKQTQLEFYLPEQKGSKLNFFIAFSILNNTVNRSIIGKIRGKNSMSKQKDENTKMNLRRLFFGALMPLLLVTLVSGFVFLAVFNFQTKRFVISQSEGAITELSGKITDYIAPALINIKDFVVLARFEQEENVLNELVHGFAENITYSLSFYFSTAKSRFEQGGFYVDSSDWTPPEDWIPQKRPWFMQSKDTDELCYESPYIDDMTGGLCVSLSQRVLDADGDFPGVVAVDLLMKDMADMISTVSVSEHGKIYMVLSDGTYLTNENESKITTANYFDDSHLSASEYLDGQRHAFVSDGRYFASGRIGETPWYLVAEGPITDFSGATMRNIILFVLILFVFSIFASVVNVSMIKGMREGEKGIGERIYNETQNLVVSAKENAHTAQEQSAAVKEIVSTMEDCTSLSEDISKKITDVSSLALKTNGDIAEGVDLIAGTVSQLHKIAEANKLTIDGIKELGEKISNIWDIVTLINSVADQAKIIAFNAELEASSAGAAGKNFHIVATEIRRLADGIIDGTKEIKGKIGEIEKSSDSLILMSENGTEKIAGGVESAKLLENKFASMKNASEITTESAEKITEIIKQQTIATEQILITLKQISSGVESFTQATNQISTASQTLNDIAEGLS